MKNSVLLSKIRLVWVVIFSFSVYYCSSQSNPDSVSFRKTVITRDFVSEGVAVGDVNHDGKMDVMAGSFWFESPNWTRHNISSPKIFFPDTSFSNSFLDFSMDVNQDGWIDLIRVGFPGEELVWYENPKNARGFWKEHMIYRHIGNESPALVDIDGARVLKATGMLKQILSVSDVKKLQVGAELFDNSEFSLAKIYIVQNVSNGTIYAVHENGHRELKILKTDEMPYSSWWVERE